MGDTVIHVYAKTADRIAASIRAAAPERRVVPLATRDALRAAMGEVEVLFVGRPPRDGWANAERLRLVQMMGVGVESLLPSPDLPDRVVVAGARGVFAAETAEYAVAAMLALCRRLPRILDQQRERRFRQIEAPKLEGRTVAILGLGEIGRRVARTCAALGMHVVGMCRTPRDVEHVAEVRGPDGLAELLDGADWVVVSLPKTPATTNLLDARAIGHMKRGARLVNVARGGIVDEGALRAALESGHVAGAAVDVFADEPLGEDSPWWTAPNTIVSPHVAGFGERYVERCIDVLLDNVGRLERDEPFVHVADRSTGY